MNIAKPLMYAVALASLSLTACGGTAADGDGSVGTATEAARGNHGAACHGALTFNALTFNALTFNALTFNALTRNALTFNALTSNALTFNALTFNALRDPNSREVLSYIVSCALPSDQSVSVTVDGTEYTYQGELGLAPEWGTPNGSCDGRCQQWVSACLLSRVDYLGKEVEISVRGENEGLKSCPDERAAYDQIEATYYGNIFIDMNHAYACLPPGQTEIPRVCGPDLNGCVVNVQGSCDDLCGKAKPVGGYYPDCRAPDADDAWKKHDQDDAYEGSITVFLKP